MSLNLCIFESQDVSGFGPLAELRFAGDLRSGAYTFRERFERQFEGCRISYLMRDEILPLYSHLNLFDPAIMNSGTDFLLIDANVILSDHAAGILLNADQACYVSNEKIVAVKLRKDNPYLDSLPDPYSVIANSIDKLNNIQLDVQHFEFPWELVKAAQSLINNDTSVFSEEKQSTRTDLTGNSIVNGDDNLSAGYDITMGVCCILNAEHNPIVLGNNVSLGSGVIIDANEGPILIDDDVKIESGAIVMGPVYIGRNSIIRPGAKVSDGVCLGPHCRIGGEVSASIMQGYSSKQHSGYMGNCYIGSWVNLGAATDNSDLKNNYRPISVTIGGRIVDTGDLHIGAIIGDFCRTAIHTKLNSGSVTGTCCNLFGSEFPDKSVPSFIWHGDNGYQEYLFDKAIETIRVMMPRRGKELTPVLENRLSDIFQKDSSLRNSFLQSQ